MRGKQGELDNEEEKEDERTAGRMKKRNWRIRN
jgi:hypothetical protein